MGRRHAHGPVRPRLSRGHQFWLYLTGGLLLGSGLGWLISHYLLRTLGAFGPEPHPAEVWWLRLHGVAVLGFLVTFGAALPGHVQQSWRHRLNRYSGGFVVLLVALLAVTGYGLYYIVADALRDWVSVIHWSIGLLACGATGAHVVLSRRRVTRLRRRQVHALAPDALAPQAVRLRAQQH